MRGDEGRSHKKVVKPTSRRLAVAQMIDRYQLSERRACQIAGLQRSVYRYKAHSKDDSKLRAGLKALATRHSSYGYLFLHALLKQKKLVKNKKRTYRIYREEGLQVRTKLRKKLQRPRLPMVVPTRVNERWSMDFVSDQLSCGRRFRVLNVIDDYNREMIGQLVSVLISGRQVARFLSELIERRGQPETVVCDNGTEFTSKAMFFWSGDTGVKLGFIQPGKPTQNAFVESLNGKFRKECLSANWFRSLNYLPPVEFARQAV